MAAAAAEDGWEGTRVEVDAAHWKEEGEQQLELNRWRAHVAALKKILGRATVAAATAIGREACRLGGFDGNPSCHAVLHLDAPRTAMALAALQNAMGGTGTSIAKLNIGGHGPTWPVSSSSSCTPTPSSSQSCRAMQGRQSCNKRKLPCSNIMIFRSPLSRMILSPRLGTPHAPSPMATSKKRTSPSVTTYGGQRVLTEIDLNVSPCEERDIINSNVSSCEERDTIDLNAEPHELEEPNTEMEEENVEPVQLQGAQQRRTEVPLGIRKAVFEALLARSKSGYLKGHETGEVSTQFSVHFCTVQCIWAEERNVWIEEPLLMFRVKKSKRGRKKKEVDISKLR